MNISGLEEALMRGISRASGESVLVLDCPAGVSAVRIAAGLPDSRLFFYNRDFADYQVLAQDLPADSCAFGPWHAPAKQHDSAVLFLPRGRESLAMTLDMTCRAVKPGGTILIAGEKRGGMGAARTLLEEACGHIMFSDSARHCVVIAGKNPGPGGGPGSLEGWMSTHEVEVLGKKLAITSCPGVFSHGRMDPATALLIGNLDRREAGSVLDFGCGSGVIGSAISAAWEGVAVDMLDTSALALECARRTVAANGLAGIRILASEGFTSAGSSYDLIVSNPPFHSGPAMEYGVIEMLWRESGERLASGGRLVLVTSGAVPASLTEEGGMKKTRILARTRNYRVTEAAK